MQVIGGVTLTHDMIVENNFTDSTNSVQIEQTLGGSNYITLSTSKNVEILNFSATDTTGWQHYNIVQNLLSLSQAGTVFSVNLNGDSFEAIFNGPVEFKKLVATTIDGSVNDYYIGSFQLVKLN